MENKNKSISAQFSTILWGGMAILLCAPAYGAVLTVEAGDTLNVGTGKQMEEILSGDWWWVDVYGTLNMYSGAYIEPEVYAFPGSVVNVRGGNLGMHIWVTIDEPLPVVTVYGTDFGGDGDFSVPGQVTFPTGSGTLTGYYPDGSAINLAFVSDIPIFLEAPGGEPLEAQLWIFPRVINRRSPLPRRMLALLRLPKGISKDEIDSGQRLVLNPGGIEPACQYAFEWYEHGTVRTSIFACFDKAELMGAVPDNGEVEIKLVGRLKRTGQYFYGSDTIIIISRYWRPRWRHYDNND